MKRLTMIGIFLVILAIGVIYLTSLNFSSNFSNSTVIALQLNSNTTAFSQFNVTNDSLFGLVYYTNGIGINYFLLNQSAYSKISQYSKSPSLLYGAANSLNGQGTIYITYNSPVNTYSPTYAGNGTANATITLQKGTYYNVFSNPTASNTLLYYSLILKQKSSITSTILSSAAYGIIGIALFVGGIIAFIYSVIFGKKQEEKASSDEDVSKLYARYERPSRRRKKESKRRKM